MSTATSSMRNIKSTLPTSNSIHNMTNNGNENKSNGIYSKRPSSVNNVFQNYSSTNGFNNHVKRRSFHHQNKAVKSIAERKLNGHHANTQTSNSSSSAVIFHAIAPAPVSEESCESTRKTNEEQKV
jgi:hypothetical protein